MGMVQKRIGPEARMVPSMVEGSQKGVLWSKLIALLKMKLSAAPESTNASIETVEVGKCN